MPFTVLDCDRKQLLILKRLYLAQLPFTQRRLPLWLAMPLANHLISDEKIYNEFDGMFFLPEDFA